jgi:hypothetical protein
MQRRALYLAMAVGELPGPSLEHEPLGSWSKDADVGN